MKLDIRNIDFSAQHIHKKYDQSFITRYLLVASLVNEVRIKTKKTKLTILDLGGYNGAARELFPEDRVIILDVFKDDELKDYIRVSEVGIPLQDNEVDIVISTDTLEHIPQDGRKRFLSDAVRVAKYATIIAAPIDHDGRVGYEERMVNSIYKGETGHDYLWLKEHMEYGLPMKQFIDDELTKMPVSFTSIQHSDLRLWGKLITAGFFIANNVNEVDSKLAAKLRRLNTEYFRDISSLDFPEEGGYRTVYVISKEYENITIITPYFDRKVINAFTSKVDLVLGKVISQLSEQLAARANQIEKDRMQIEKMSKRLEKLEQMEVSYNNIINSSAYQIINQISHIKRRYMKK